MIRFHLGSFSQLLCANWHQEVRLHALPRDSLWISETRLAGQGAWKSDLGDLCFIFRRFGQGSKSAQVLGRLMLAFSDYFIAQASMSQQKIPDLCAFARIEEADSTTVLACTSFGLSLIRG